MTTELQEIQETVDTQDQENVDTQETEETVEIQEIEVESSTDEPEVPSVLRTRRNGVWEVYNGAWGRYLRPIDDPDANIVINEDNLKVFELNPNIHRIPADLWARWVKLCFYYVDKVASSLEVSIRILRSEEDPSKYRFLVPKQEVSGASVRVENFDKAIDIETGEEITQYPPTGWIPVGSSHSHNTMPSFFSGIDDKYELGDPGIHLVVGGIKVNEMKYTIAASVVGSGRRFEMDYSNLVDATPIPDVDFHPKVLEYVDYTSRVGYSSGVYTSSYTSSSGFDYSKYGGIVKYQKWLNQVYGDTANDPYYYDDGSFTGRKNAKSKALELWELEELINEYVEEHRNDYARLGLLADELSGVIREIETQFTIDT